MTWQERSRSLRTDGLAQLRSGVPPWKILRQDVLAGLPGAISSVPDGMAASVLVGVSPVHGLYASFAAPIAGGLSQSTKLMVVTTTSASALAAGSALASTPSAQRPQALFLLTLIAGILMVVAGVLHLGRYTRFVPHSVMIGFLTGISLNIIFGQIPDLVGYHATGPYNLAKFVDTLRHLGDINVASLLTGLSAIALILLLGRGKLAPVSAIIALVVPTVVLVVAGVHGVATVNDSGVIPSGLPTPSLPHLRDLNFGVITGAMAIVAIILVQGAGVAESAPNPDGSRSSSNRNFVAQGAGNIASSLFQGQPTGGSVGQTALNIKSGARTRWAAILSGCWMLIILLLFAKPVGKVAMPTLAAVLIVAAFGSFRFDQINIIWRTSTISRVGLVTTFLSTLFLPVAAAVGIGVAVALLLQLNQEAVDLRIVELIPLGDNRFEEHEAPRVLPSHAVTVLDIYGSLYYAGARTLQSRLPDPGPSTSAAVVIRLRGRTMVGATFVVVIEDYLKRLRVGGGQLFLTGVAPDVAEQLVAVHRFDEGDVHVLNAEVVIGATSQKAVDRAREWLEDQPESVE